MAAFNHLQYFVLHIHNYFVHSSPGGIIPGYCPGYCQNFQSDIHCLLWLLFYWTIVLTIFLFWEGGALIVIVHT